MIDLSAEYYRIRLAEFKQHCGLYPYNGFLKSVVIGHTWPNIEMWTMDSRRIIVGDRGAFNNKIKNRGIVTDSHASILRRADLSYAFNTIRKKMWSSSIHKIHYILFDLLFGREPYREYITGQEINTRMNAFLKKEFSL